MKSLCCTVPLLALAAATSPAFRWIRDIEAGPPGRKYSLNATTYLIDRQYQLPAGTEIAGAGSGGNGTVIRYVASRESLAN